MSWKIRNFLQVGKIQLENELPTPFYHDILRRKMEKRMKVMFNSMIMQSPIGLTNFCQTNPA
jgi:hypothetical protein